MREEPAAFGLWLTRDLKQRFSPTMREPIPANLLALIDTLPSQD